MLKALQEKVESHSVEQTCSVRVSDKGAQYLGENR